MLVVVCWFVGQVGAISIRTRTKERSTITADHRLNVDMVTSGRERAKVF